jgi:hypothetical protein
VTNAAAAGSRASASFDIAEMRAVLDASAIVTRVEPALPTLDRMRLTSMSPPAPIGARSRSGFSVAHGHRRIDRGAGARR